MATIVSILALAFAAVACAAAVRTQRTVHRLAKALAREWGLRTGPNAASAPRTGGEGEPLAEREEWLKRSVEALEQRLRELLARTAGLEAQAPAGPTARGPSARVEVGGDPRERLRRHLEASGYEDVAVLPGLGRNGSLVFEARREGMPAKGSARVGADGRVEVRWAAPHRVFP
jgi:hypothetical protein